MNESCMCDSLCDLAARVLVVFKAVRKPSGVLLVLLIIRLNVFSVTLLVIFKNLSHQVCKGPLAKEKVCGLLVFPDLTERHGARLIAARLWSACRCC
jgi:hypothetical protein